MSKNRLKTLKTAIGAKIKTALEELEWTQQDLADKLRKDKAHISNILNGKQNLTLETIAEIERVLGRDLIPLDEEIS
jgi:transcriptional regulator with XRE-family HTH domain